jgi:spore coat polysaccharide biosynthesis protein SpsF
MKVVAIVQARMGSTRLPGKVLLDMGGEPMLARVVSRMSQARTVDEVVVATTAKPVDDAIVRLCADRGWPFFRGSEEDVLDRYYRTAETYRADVVVRITSDCPLIDGGVVDCVVGEFLYFLPEIEYACNISPSRTFPRGLDTEVMRFDVLERLSHEVCSPAWREHVTLCIRRRPELYQVHSIVNEPDYSHMRWTVDTPEDLTFVRLIYDQFGHDRFTWREVLAVLAKHPEWLEINRRVRQKVV